jgi:hypothetical protein
MRNSIEKILRMVGIFKMAFNRWPQTAVELMGFAEERGWELDLSSYHTLTFQGRSHSYLWIDMSWRGPCDWISRSRVELELAGDAFRGDHLHWTVKTKTLPSIKRKARSYCWVEPKVLLRRKSA